MTDFARCKDCAALTLDTDDDIRKHRLDHKDRDQKLEAQRRVANDAKQAVTQLRADIAQYERDLKASLVTVEPDQIVINDFPDDDTTDDPEPDELEDNLGDELEPATTAPAVDYTVPPAIDRDDTITPATGGHTATAQNLFNG